MKRLKKMSKIKFFAKIVDFCKFLKVPSSRNIGFLENKNLQDIRYIKNVVYPSYHESFMPLSEEQQKEKQEKKVMKIEKIFLPGETEEGYSWRVLENIAKIGMVDFSVRCCRDFFLLQKNEKISDDIKSYYPNVSKLRLFLPKILNACQSCKKWQAFFF